MEVWEIAWMAGLFEGEGCISFHNRASVQVKILMCDRDVIEAADKLFPSPRGVGRWDYPGKKTQWRWQLSDRDEVRGFLETVRPYLHSRRRARADEAIARLAICYGDHAKRTHCKRNHPLSGENLSIAANGTRHCKACQKERDRNRVRVR